MGQGSTVTDQPHKSILYIVHEYPPIVGGAGQLVYDMVEAIRQERHVVVLTASQNSRSHHEQQGNADLVKLSIPFRHKVYHYATAKSLIVFVLKAILAGRRLGKRHRFEAIHAYYLFPSGLVAVVLSRLLGVPCYITAVGAEVFDPSRTKTLYNKWYYRRFMAAIMKRATALSAISQDIADRVKQFCDRKPIAILPPGLPDPVGRPEPQPHDDFVITSLSRLAPRKGLDLTIEALAELKHLPIRYIMMGDGHSRQELIDLAERLGVRDRIELTGFVTEDQKHAILSRSDLFVLASLHEGFGICYLEAMAAGLPIIAHSVGGQRDFIQDGENGYLLPAREKQHLVEAILKLYEHPEQRREMGQRNREQVRRYYTSHLKNVYLDHYRESVAASQASG